MYLKTVSILSLLTSVAWAASLPLQNPAPLQLDGCTVNGRALEASMLPGRPAQGITVNASLPKAGKTILKPQTPFKATGLTFTHTTHPGQGINDYRLAVAQAHRNLEVPSEKPTLFSYEIIYEDGQKLVVPVRWGESIESWYRHHSVSPMLWAQNPVVNGTDPVSGEKTAVYPMEWPNPRPGTAIAEVRVLPNADAWVNYGTSFILSVSVSQEAPQGKVYYVDPTPVGDDSQPGSFEQPFGTLPHAFKQLTPGDTLYLRGGYYALNRAAVLEEYGEANGKWITISAFPGETPVIDGFGVLFDPRLAPYKKDSKFGPPYQHDFGVIAVWNASGYVRIQGLHVQNSRRTGISADGKQFRSQQAGATRPTHLAINFNTTDRCNEMGINIKFWDDVEVIGNRVCRPHSAAMTWSIPGDERGVENLPPQTPVNNRHHGQEGIDLSNNTRFVIAYNEVYGGSKEAIDCISVQDGEIYNNYVHSSLNGIYIDSWAAPIHGLKIYRNYIHDAFNGIPLSTEGGGNQHNTDIYENIIIDSHSSGIPVQEATYKATPAKIYNIRVFNNTIFKGGGHAESINWLAAGISLKGFAQNPNVKDNAVFNNIVSEVNQLPYVSNYSNLEERNILFHHNLAWPDADRIPERLKPNQKKNVWLAVPEKGRINADPLFVNPEAGDFRLRENSPARKAGTDGKDLGALPFGSAWMAGFDFNGQPTAHYHGPVKWEPVFIPNHLFNTHRTRIQRPRFFQESRYGEDFEHLPSGMLAMAGVIWQIEQDTNSSQPNVITLAGVQTEAVQSSVTGIPVDRKASRLAFLHTAYVASPQRRALSQGGVLEVAEYVIRYADGSSVNIPVIIGKNVGSWKDDRNLPEARVAYMLYGSNRGNPIRSSLFSFEWTNPKPETKISSIDFNRTGDPQAGTPALFAISTGH